MKKMYKDYIIAQVMSLADRDDSALDYWCSKPEPKGFDWDEANKIWGDVISNIICSFFGSVDGVTAIEWLKEHGWKIERV